MIPYKFTIDPSYSATQSRAKAQQQMRERIAADVEAFLDSGGKITIIPSVSDATPSFSRDAWGHGRTT